jgi:hypothetical protein
LLHQQKNYCWQRGNIKVGVIIDDP